MSRSRLYYNIEAQPDRKYKFCYHSTDIDEMSYQLRSFSLNVNNENVVQTVQLIGASELLSQMNESEYKNLLISIERKSNEIENLTKTDPISANKETVKMWGPKELQNKFKNWFEENGYPVPE